MGKLTIPEWPGWIQLKGNPNRGVWATRFEGLLYNITLKTGRRGSPLYSISLTRQGDPNRNESSVWVPMIHQSPLERASAHAIRANMMARLDAYVVAGVL